MLHPDAGQPEAAGVSRRPLYPVSRVHLDVLGTDLGLWQHARGSEPDPRFGYCTDDVARSMVVDVLHSRELGWPVVDSNVGRSLRFLTEAFGGASGRFLNMRSADGRWLDMDASQDCHARALVGLAAVARETPDSESAAAARSLFVSALPAVESFDAIRAVSAVTIACDAAGDVPALGAAAEPVLWRLAIRLAGAFAETDAEWPWPEPLLAYENAIVPRALIVAGRRLDRQDLVALGCRTLDWLIEVQTGESGIFRPIGNATWWRRGATRSRFDQQPIEAGTMVDAAADAYRATGRQRYRDAAEMAYGWFLGDNDLGVRLALPATGGCQDGLTPSGPNTNQGAESTLMWLTALERMRDLRRAPQTERSSNIAAKG